MKQAVVMARINVQDAKTNLSRYLEAVEGGEVVVLCRHNKPVAELRPIESARPVGEPRKFGHWEGFGVSEGFFEPLSEDLLKDFDGE